MAILPKKPKLTVFKEVVEARKWVENDFERHLKAAMRIEKITGESAPEKIKLFLSDQARILSEKLTSIIDRLEKHTELTDLEEIAAQRTTVHVSLRDTKDNGLNVFLINELAYDLGKALIEKGTVVFDEYENRDNQTVTVTARVTGVVLKSHPHIELK